MDEWLEQYGQGQCINCGFLAKMGFDNRPPHPGSRVWDIEAVPIVHREHGSLFQLRDGYPSVPTCHIGANPLHLEFVQARKNRLSELAKPPADAEGFEMQVLRNDVLAKERGCSQWMPWTENWTPERHREECHTQQLERQRKELEERMERDRRDFAERMEKNRRDFEKGFKRLTVWLTVVGIVVAVAGVTTAVFVST